MVTFSWLPKNSCHRRRWRRIHIYCPSLFATHRGQSEEYEKDFCICRTHKLPFDFICTAKNAKMDLWRRIIPEPISSSSSVMWPNTHTFIQGPFVCLWREYSSWYRHRHHHPKIAKTRIGIKIRLPIPHANMPTPSCVCCTVLLGTAFTV